MHLENIHATKVFIPKKIQHTIGNLSEFCEINFSFANEYDENAHADFVFFTEENAIDNIKFNIAFIENIGQAVAIESGGIAIVPENIEIQYTTLHQEDTFQRVLSYPITLFSEGENHIDIGTDWGNITLPENQKAIAQNFSGIQLLASQIGIYEDAFYEFFLSY